MKTTHEWVNEAEPFPAFLATLSAIELAALLHEARHVGDDVTMQAALAEFKRREAAVSTMREQP